MMLSFTDKIHHLFKAFHEAGLPNARDLCNDLKKLIDTKKIRGSGEIALLHEKLLSKEIGLPKMLDAIYHVTEEEDSDDESYTDSESEADPEDVPEPENPPVEGLSEKDKKNVLMMCQSIADQIKDMEYAFLHQSRDRALHEIKKTSIFIENFTRILDFIKEN